MIPDDLTSARFAGEKSLLDQLNKIPEVQRGISTAEAVRARESSRTELLASAVRLSSRMLPQLKGALDRVGRLLGQDAAIEAYVFPAPVINAFVTRDGATTIVALSSGAIQMLHGEELDFVVGHEFGHAHFGHLDFNAQFLLASGAVGARDSMRLRAWQRAAEVSADRAGLVACRSFEAASTAFFKTLSGLDVRKGDFDAIEFSAQWEELRREVASSGERSHWERSHPFSPLRMRAMHLFWTATDGDGASPERLAAVDREVSQMLATMDPESAADADAGPDLVLASYFFWGGLYIALADGKLEPREIARLQQVAPQGTAVEALVADPAFAPAQCLERFKADVKARKRKLSSVELHRIVQGLIDVAAADGVVDDGERERLYELGAAIGIGRPACDLILSRATTHGG